MTDLDDQERERLGITRSVAWTAFLDEGNEDTTDLRNPFFDGFDAGYQAALSTREESQTVWTCMSCGEIGDAQSCAQCGHEAMPGRWLEAKGVERQLKDAWRQRDEALVALREMESELAVLRSTRRVPSEASQDA